ncbi:MAG: lytic transglycosylase domain-containing protein [Thermoanaerobaculia bacterium]|nr:lytic transglycosylase domain-containing protein [Thermoanaerobaculia bacterium]
MRITLIAAVVFLGSGLLHADDRKFTASDVKVKLNRQPGKIVIKNDTKRITAFRFFGDIRESLVNLRATRQMVTRPFGSVFNSTAKLNSPVPPYLAAIIAEASAKHGVDPRLVAAVTRRESAYNPNAISPVGASGLMQLMPATAKFLGVTDVFDARQNIHGGTRYLRTLLDTFNGDLDLTLAAYNAGPGAVRKYNGVPPYRETRNYVASIRANYEQSLR